MTTQTPDGIDRIESAANISLVLTQGSTSGEDVPSPGPMHPPCCTVQFQCPP